MAYTVYSEATVIRIICLCLFTAQWITHATTWQPLYAIAYQYRSVSDKHIYSGIVHTDYKLK